MADPGTVTKCDPDVGGEKRETYRNTDNRNRTPDITAFYHRRCRKYVLQLGERPGSDQIPDLAAAQKCGRDRRDSAAVGSRLQQK